MQRLFACKNIYCLLAICSDAMQVWQQIDVFQCHKTLQEYRKVTELFAAGGDVLIVEFQKALTINSLYRVIFFFNNNECKAIAILSNLYIFQMEKLRCWETK